MTEEHMNKEKQIEEMSRTASKCITSWLNNETSKALPDYIAEALYTAGYCKSADVAREIFEDIERETKNHGITYTQCKIVELKKKYTEEGRGVKCG